MPTNNGFNTGKDITLVIVTPTGVLNAGGVTSFKSRQTTTPLDSKLLSGINLYDQIPTGWSGSFDFERLDSTLDDYFALNENNYYTSVQANTTVTISETIQENNGAITQYRYTGVDLVFENAGDWTGTATVKQSVSFRASRRLKVQ